MSYTPTRSHVKSQLLNYVPNNLVVSVLTLHSLIHECCPQFRQNLVLVGLYLEFKITMYMGVMFGFKNFVPSLSFLRQRMTDSSLPCLCLSSLHMEYQLIFSNWPVSLQIRIPLKFLQVSRKLGFKDI